MQDGGWIAVMLLQIGRLISTQQVELNFISNLLLFIILNISSPGRHLDMFLHDITWKTPFWIYDHLVDTWLNKYGLAFLGSSARFLFSVSIFIVLCCWFVFIGSRLRASSILFTTTLGLFGSLTSCLGKGKRGRRQKRRGSQPKSPCTQPHLTWTAWALPSSPPPPPSPPLIGSHSPQHLGQLQNIKLFSQVEIMSRVVSDYFLLP